MSGKNKIFWIDTETSGLDPIKNDILTLSALVEIDGKIQAKINLKTQPYTYNNIDPKALEVNGLKLEDIKNFPTPQETHNRLVAFFDQYIDRYDKKDKFIPAGYNVNFDTEFLFKFFAKSGDPYCGSYLDYHKLDIASLVLFFKIHGLFDFHGFKLSQVAQELEIPLNAHRAEDDIIATRKIYHALMKKIEIKK